MAIQRRPKPPRIDRNSDRYRQLIGGFRVYRLPGEAGEALPVPRIYTCYRGIPVASEARVAHADNERVTFEVNRYQSNAIARTGFALVKSPLHGLTFRAYADRVDLEAGLASFTHFVRHEDAGERRREVRLEPDLEIPATLRLERRRLAGTLLDLSVSAAALLIPDADPSMLREGVTGRVTVDVPAEAGRVRVDAGARISRFLAWAGDDPNDFRVVLALETDEPTRHAIAAWVTEQQSAILRSLSARG